MDNPLARLQKEIADLLDDLGTWEKVGNHYGVHRIVVWRIVNDRYEPKSNDVRRKLGLPEIIQRKAYRDKLGRFVRPPVEG